MSNRKDIDYLSISARIHAMENRLLTRERMDRMIEAKDSGDAAKILTECGYGELSQPTLAGLEILLSQARATLLKDMAQSVPEGALVAVFQLKYDYHNAKVLVKSEKSGRDPAPLMLEGGRYAPHPLSEGFARGDVREVSDQFKKALQSARDILATTGDPQRADFALDRGCFEEMASLARQADSSFLAGFVKLSIDSANLRAAVRAARLNKGEEFLKLALLPDGNVSTHTIANTRASDLVSLFQSGPLAAAAEAGSRVASAGSGTLTGFERLCDDAITTYLTAARMVAFGEATVIGYLYARDAELTAIRTIMAGRLAGLDGDVIRGRLRASYV